MQEFSLKTDSTQAETHKDKEKKSIHFVKQQFHCCVKRDESQIKNYREVFNKRSKEHEIEAMSLKDEVLLRHKKINQKRIHHRK